MKPGTASGPAQAPPGRGVTPVLRRLSKRREVSSVVAVTPAGQPYARHVRGSISGQVVIRALRHFRRKIGRPLLIVWDRLNAHRAHRTAAFLARYARDIADLGQLVRRAFRPLQHRADFLIGCFQHAGLRITQIP